MWTRRAASHPAEELRRVRKDLARPRRRAALRILVADDPRRPVRAVVLPRLLPAAGIAVAVGLALVAATSLLTSWRLRGSVGHLQGRVSAMVHAAEAMAAHPLGDGVVAAVPDVRGLRKPAGPQDRFVESVNTGEQVEVVVDLATGEPEAASYRRLRHLMRCLRTGAETPLDPRLVELLYRIAKRTRQKVELVSGSRAPMFSSADLSYHTRGMAADIRIPGMTPLMVRDLVLAMGVKGVGYYPLSRFVHVDVRAERALWTDYGRNRADGERAEHGPDPAAAGAEP